MCPNLCTCLLNFGLNEMNCSERKAPMRSIYYHNKGYGGIWMEDGSRVEDLTEVIEGLDGKRVEREGSTMVVRIGAAEGRGGGPRVESL